MRFAPILMAGLAAAASVTPKRDSVAASSDVEKTTTANLVSAAAYCGGYTYAGCSNACYKLDYTYYACLSTVCYCFD